MAGQPERIFLMMFGLIQVIAITSGMWWLLAAAHLLNIERILIQILHHRMQYLLEGKPERIRLFDFLAARFGFQRECQDFCV